MGRNTRILLVMTAFVLSGLNSGNSLSAQSTLGFDAVGFIGMPDTVATGEQWLVGAFVKNYSSFDSLMNDSVRVIGYIDSLSGPTTPWTSPWVSGVSLGPNDTVFFILPILFDASSSGNGFRIGNNVIVVWPITSHPNYGSDSLSVNVFVVTGVSTGPDPEVGEVRFFPVPASGPLFVTSSNRSLVVKEITIRDAAGKIIAVSDNPREGINTDEWASGIYMLEVTFDNGKRSVYKIIK